MEFVVQLWVFLFPYRMLNLTVIGDYGHAIFPFKNLNKLIWGGNTLLHSHASIKRWLILADGRLSQVKNKIFNKFTPANP